MTKGCVRHVVCLGAAGHGTDSRPKTTGWESSFSVQKYPSQDPL